jgi:hypothetical protein
MLVLTGKGIEVGRFASRSQDLTMANHGRPARQANRVESRPRRLTVLIAVTFVASLGRLESPPESPRSTRRAAHHRYRGVIGWRGEAIPLVTFIVRGMTASILTGRGDPPDLAKGSVCGCRPSPSTARGHGSRLLEAAVERARGGRQAAVTEAPTPSERAPSAWRANGTTPSRNPSRRVSGSARVLEGESLPRSSELAKVFTSTRAPGDWSR